MRRVVPRHAVLAALAMLGVACFEPPVAETLLLEFLPDGLMTLTARVRIRDIEESNPALRRRIEDARRDALEGTDAWSRRFEALGPVIERGEWEKHEGRLVSLSLDKAVVAVPVETRFQSTRVTLNLEGFPPLQTELKQVTQRRGDISRSGDKRRYYLHLHFDLRGFERDKMIIKLYTGTYSQDVPDIDKVAVSVNLMLRAFGRTRTA